MPHTSPEASLIKAVGGFGSIFVTGTQAYTGNFHAIQATEDCLFSQIQSSNMENVSGWLAKTLYAGVVLESDFTTVQLSSGAAVLYKH
jgi:hypothetical protein